MRIVRNKGYGQSPVGMIKIITPLPSQLGRIRKFILHQPSHWKTTRRSLISSPIQYEKIYKSSIQHPRILFLRQLSHQRRPRRNGARRIRRHRPLLLSRYGRNDLNLIRYGERSCFSDTKPRAGLGEVPSPKSTVSFTCF